MEIGGLDLIYHPAKDFDVKEAIRKSVEKHWPVYTIEFDEDDGDRAEFFVYKNENCEASWGNDGWTRENANTMIYVIWERSLQSTTLVVDHLKEVDPHSIFAIVSDFHYEILKDYGKYNEA